MTDPLGALKRGNHQTVNTQTNNPQNDPRVQQGIDYVNSHGGDPKAAAMELLKERNIPIPSNPLQLAMQLLSGRR